MVVVGRCDALLGQLVCVGGQHVRYGPRGLVDLPEAYEQLLAVQLLYDVSRQRILAGKVNHLKVRCEHLKVLSILALHFQMIGWLGELLEHVARDLWPKYCHADIRQVLHYNVRTAGEVIDALLVLLLPLDALSLLNCICLDPKRFRFDGLQLVNCVGRPRGRGLRPLELFHNEGHQSGRIRSVVQVNSSAILGATEKQGAQ